MAVYRQGRERFLTIKVRGWEALKGQ
jgi:hypothetical protein